MESVSDISSTKYKQVVIKVYLNELLASIEQRKYMFHKARLTTEFALKERTFLKKPHCKVIRNALNV